MNTDGLDFAGCCFGAAAGTAVVVGAVVVVATGCAGGAPAPGMLALTPEIETPVVEELLEDDAVLAGGAAFAAAAPEVPARRRSAYDMGGGAVVAGAATSVLAGVCCVVPVDLSEEELEEAQELPAGLGVPPSARPVSSEAGCRPPALPAPSMMPGAFAEGTGAGSRGTGAAVDGFLAAVGFGEGEGCCSGVAGPCGSPDTRPVKAMGRKRNMSLSTK